MHIPTKLPHHILILASLWLVPAALADVAVAQGGGKPATGKPAAGKDTKPAEAPKPTGDKPAATEGKGDKVDFATQVLPLLEKKCTECHRAPFTDENGKKRRPKGGVMFDTREGIERSKKGKLVVAGKPDSSLMIQAISLPADDEDRMPPAKKGDPLPAEEIALLKKWIEEGAAFGEWTGKAKDNKGGDGKGEPPADGKPADGKPTDGKPTGGKTGEDQPKGDGKGDHHDGDDDEDDGGHGRGRGRGRGRGGDGELLLQLGAGLLPLDDAALQRCAELGAHVEPVAPESPLVRVTFYGNEQRADARALQDLQAAAGDHVAELVLARAPIDDEAAGLLLRFPRLLHLDLRETAIGDAGVAALAALPHLRSLNLYATHTGDAGAAALAGCASLREVWLWNTPASAAAAVQLTQALPQARIVFAADLPTPSEADAPTGRARRR